MEITAGNIIKLWSQYPELKEEFNKFNEFAMVMELGGQEREEIIKKYPLLTYEEEIKKKRKKKHMQESQKQNSQEMATANITKIDRYHWLCQHERGKYAEINKHEMVIDHEYQRRANERRILAITKNWSWVAFGTIAITKRNSKYYVLDGQHRVMAAMRRSDVEELPCMVFELNGIEEEALAFIMLNKERKPPISIDTFQAEVATKNPAALLVKDLCEKANRVIGRAANAGTVQCTGALLQYAAKNPEVLKRLWPLLMKFFEGRIFHERLVKGFMYLELYLENNSLTEKKLTERVLQIGWDKLYKACGDYQALTGKGGEKVWAQGMLIAINAKGKEKFKLRTDSY